MFGVFDRQIMQVELRLHPKQQVAVRLEQADPDDVAGLCRPYAGLFDRNVGDALAGGIDAGRNNAGCRLQGRGQVSNLLHRKPPETRLTKSLHLEELSLNWEAIRVAALHLLDLGSPIPRHPADSGPGNTTWSVLSPFGRSAGIWSPVTM